MILKNVSSSRNYDSWITAGKFTLFLPFLYLSSFYSTKRSLLIFFFLYWDIIHTAKIHPFKISNLVGFAYLLFAQPSPLSKFIIFHDLKKKRGTIYESVPILSSIHPLTTANLLAISMKLPVVDISYKWNHTICSLLCLASIEHHVFKVHLCIVGIYQFFTSF